MLLLMLKQIRLKVKYVICCSPIAVENKIPNVSNLIKKTDYKTKISEIENKIATDYDHDKYITTS